MENTSSLPMSAKRSGSVSPEVAWFASGSAKAADASQSDRTTAVVVAQLNVLITRPSLIDEAEGSQGGIKGKEIQILEGMRYHDPSLVLRSTTKPLY